MSKIIVTPEMIDAQKRYILEAKTYFHNKSISKGRPLKFSIRTYGCQQNESDSEKLSGILSEMGLYSCDEDEMPDVLMLNTCSIRENAQDRLFGNLGRWKTAKMNHSDMIIVVCGCMMKQEYNVDKIDQSYRFVDLVFGPQDIFRLPELMCRYLSNHKKVIDVSDEDYIVEDQDSPVIRKRKFRALVPIMYGCNNYCAYCVVPYTRGAERSRNFDSILSQVKSLDSEGYKEIMLLGQNVNSYGNDDPDKPKFFELLDTIAQNTQFEHIRFMTSHPKDISENLIDIIAQHHHIERHLHLPFQSGSNRILKLMNRGYTREEYIKSVQLYREKVPNGTISTDIIVGFPGETEDDFQDTLSLMTTLRFDSAFTFQFSPRPGTAAEHFKGRISPEIMRDRFERLVKLQNMHAFESNQSIVNTKQNVLIEGISHTSDDVFTGRTSTNRLVNFSIPEHIHFNLEDLEGKMGIISIQQAKTFSVEGELERIIYDQ